jgi:hypothetical protein
MAMNSDRAFLVFFGVFAAAFAVLYVIAMELNWAAFTYHPRLGLFELGAKPPRTGPAMYWYGWMATSALGGLTAAVLAMVGLANFLSAKAWLLISWVVPVGAMAAAAYFMLPFFTR